VQKSLFLLRFPVLDRENCWLESPKLPNLSGDNRCKVFASLRIAESSRIRCDVDNEQNLVFIFAQIGFVPSIVLTGIS
jgi:hypothetical protein